MPRAIPRSPKKRRSLETYSRRPWLLSFRLGLGIERNTSSSVFALLDRSCTSARKDSPNSSEPLCWSAQVARSVSRGLMAASNLERRSTVSLLEADPSKTKDFWTFSSSIDAGTCTVATGVPAAAAVDRTICHSSTKGPTAFSRASWV